MPFFFIGPTFRMAQQQKLPRLITQALSYAMRAGHRWLGIRKLYTGQPTTTATDIMFHPPLVHVCFATTRDLPSS